MNIWLAMIAIGVITYCTRLSFILLFGRMEISAPVKRALRFVPQAVLPAIIFPELLLRDGTLDFSLGNARLIAGALAFLVAWRTKNAILTVSTGMAGLLVLQAVMR